jgi:hypothetical protein
MSLTPEQIAERDKQRKARKKYTQHLWYEKNKVINKIFETKNRISKKSKY